MGFSHAYTIALRLTFRVRFRTFGPLRYARITIDPVTERSRGTGFVCFWNKTDADKAVEQSETLRTETIGDTAATVSLTSSVFLLLPLFGHDLTVILSSKRIPSSCRLCSLLIRLRR